MTRLAFIVLLSVAQLAGCAVPPKVSDPTRAGLWGYVKLVPREGVQASSGAGAYGDRRLRDVALVDYSRPGFVVVYVDSPSPTPASETHLSIEDGTVRPRIEPGQSAFVVATDVRIENRSSATHVVSCPAAGLLQSLAPGEAKTFRPSSAGEYPIFLLDAPGSSSTLFAAPGAFAVVADSGRFIIDELPPGPKRLHTWHPRFPPTSRDIGLQAGEMLRIDLEIGVGRSGEARHEAD